MKMVSAYASHRDDPIGFACASDGQEGGRGGLWSVELVALYVDPDHWGCGVGGALHAWLREQLRSSRTAEAGTLYVWSLNARARRFYLRHGWSEAGEASSGPLGAPFISDEARTVEEQS